jgi:HSP20 family protein
MPQNPFQDLLGFDPFAELNAYREALRQLVETGLPMPRDLMPAGMAAIIIPIDMLDTGPDIVIQTNLPGVRPEEVSVTVIGNNLTIKGTLAAPEELQGATYLRRERRAASFVRTVTLPVAVEAEQSVARFDNGVLTLTLPKSEAVRPRTIKVVREA